MRRQLMLALTLAANFMLAGLVFGWSSLQLILEKEGVYRFVVFFLTFHSIAHFQCGCSYVCLGSAPSNTTGDALCVAQINKLNLLYALFCFFHSFVAVVMCGHCAVQIHHCHISIVGCCSAGRNVLGSISCFCCGNNVCSCLCVCGCV